MFEDAALGFWLALAVKMTAAAAVVVAATVAAERGGPLIGAMIATLPILTGPAYVFLALDHDDAFIADSAVASVAINAVTAVYSIIYVKLAQRQPLAVCIAAGFGVWLVLAYLVQAHTWTLPQAILVNLLVYPLGIWLAREERHAPMPRIPIRWTDIAVRAAGVAVMVALVITLSFSIGPGATGVLAVFPLVFTSLMVILYRRVGGRAAAAVIAHGLSGLAGLGVAAVTLHLTAVPLGRAAALPLALAVAIGWNLVLYAANRRWDSRPA